MKVCIADVLRCDYYVFDIDSDLTVLDLKKKIADHINISVDHISLDVRGIEVKDSDLLSTYGKKCAIFNLFTDFKQHVEA